MAKKSIQSKNSKTAGSAAKSAAAGGKIARAGAKIARAGGKTTAAGVKTAAGEGKTAATRKPGKTGATGIIKKTDVAERPVRSGKTGPTGIIRETGVNGMTDFSGNGAGEMKPAARAKPRKPAKVSAKGGKKR